MDQILELDKSLFIYLNSLGSIEYDPFWLIITNKFSHIDINMMCVFNRLEDLKLGKTIETSKTPLLLKYWNNLKKRESYQRGILNYYTEKEHNVIKDFYKDSPSPYLDLILDELAKRN